MAHKFWYSHHFSRWFLFPFSVLYWLISVIRRVYLQRFKQVQFSVPIIVVGNLTLGGVGKTPLVIALAQALQAKGVSVGIVSRGYGASVSFPHLVSVQDKAAEVGDEPLLIAKRTECPVVISPNRVEGVQYLLQHFQSQIIISDDGLQHYAMGRSIEIAVIDGMRGLGNGLIVPAGPLRERAGRLKKVDFVVVNSGDWPNAFKMDMVCGEITALLNGEPAPAFDNSETIAAFAAIGNPERFYATLRDLNLQFKAYSFADHYSFMAEDLVVPEKTILMTEKDAVKCLPFAKDNMYFLPISARLSNEFWDAFWTHKHLKGVLSI